MVNQLFVQVCSSIKRRINYPLIPICANQNRRGKIFDMRPGRGRKGGNVVQYCSTLYRAVVGYVVFIEMMGIFSSCSGYHYRSSAPTLFATLHCFEFLSPTKQSTYQPSNLPCNQPTYLPTNKTKLPTNTKWLQLALLYVQTKTIGSHFIIGEGK